MNDDSSHQPTATDLVDFPLPAYLRPLLPHTMLKGWLMPLVFVLLAVGFWGYSSSHLDPTPGRQLFEAFCFAFVAVVFAVGRLWIGWWVKHRKAAK
ncbi:hypothetical protein [Streptacidiphilus jiangxiensis]|uniref:Uncharacterized protein n=1 Tax=Streptacidiphilus jiangxiensis TaxID=235985 RepID=A0A1H7X790_STRJI|nr:hypothetical protein [Streptacidiphilus jiangxiensis]SEM29551.1 hypothetical protein SAMN05414137_1239 [Streptacidiphilus jiangxiensis]